MAILNEHLEFRDAIRDPRYRNATTAFLGEPRKIRLDPPTLLARFITTESKKHHGNEIFLSPWWARWRTVAAMWARWKPLHAGPREVLRGRLSITTAYSPELDAYVQVVLTSSIFCWEGFAEYKTDELRKVCYLGGGEQLFIPYFASDASGLRSDYAHIQIFSLNWVDILA